MEAAASERGAGILVVGHDGVAAGLLAVEDEEILRLVLEFAVDATSTLLLPADAVNYESLSVHRWVRANCAAVLP